MKLYGLTAIVSSFSSGGAASPEASACAIRVADSRGYSPHRQHSFGGSRLRIHTFAVTAKGDKKDKPFYGLSFFDKHIYG